MWYSFVPAGSNAVPAPAPAELAVHERKQQSTKCSIGRDQAHCARALRYRAGCAIAQLRNSVRTTPDSSHTTVVQVVKCAHHTKWFAHQWCAGSLVCYAHPYFYSVDVYLDA